MKRLYVITLAGLLGLTGLFGAVRAARACLAYADYHRAKYGRARGDVPEILRLAERAHRGYPANYYFCLWAAERVFYGAAGEAPDNAGDRLAAAEFWCNRGLDQNPYNGQLRLLKARLLECESPVQAAAFWEPYVEWNFWEPHNHAVLVELLARAGEFERALKAMQWVVGTRYHGMARESFNAAWHREMAPPPAP